MKTNNARTYGNKASRFVGLFLVLGVLLSITSVDVFAQVPPANTQIGNQASATYIDNGGNPQSITSNTVQTIVQQVAGVDINNGITLTVSPGGQVSFPHNITNTGNGVDSYNLTTLDSETNFDFDNIRIYPDLNEDGVPDNFTEIFVTPNVNPGESYGIVIVADVPITASEGNTETIVITATSAFDSNVADNSTNTVNVDEDAIINVQKTRDKQFVSVGDTVTYTFTYAESGGSSNATNLVIRDELPAGVSYAPGTGRWSGLAGVSLTDLDDGDESGITYEAFQSGSVDSVIITIANVNAGASGTVRFKVTVDPDTYGQTIINFGRFSHTDAPTPVVTNNASITVDENFDINRVGNDTVYVASAEQGSIVNFLNVFTNDGTATDTYNITFSENTYPTNPLIFKVDANGQPTSPYTDTNNDGIPDTGPIAVGDTVKVIFQLQLPSGTSGGPYGVKKTLTSVNDPTESDYIYDVLGEITTPTVDITNGGQLGSGSETGVGEGPEPTPVSTINTNPGTTVNFTLYLNNTSTQDDNYELDFATDTTGAGNLSNIGALPTGWTASFRDPSNGNSVITSSGLITAGSYKVVTFRVNIPAGYAPGDVDLFVRALSQTTGAKDIKYESVNVQTVRSISLATSQSGQVSPGGSVDYIHTLTVNSNVVENTGSAADSSDLYVNLVNSIPTGWTARVFWDTNNDGQVTAVDSVLTSAAANGAVNLPPAVGPLTYGEQVRFIVQVTASTGLNDGATVTTTITVSDQNDGSPAVNAVSNDDLTEVQAGRLSIDKYQAPDVNGTPGTFTKSQFNVLPGDTVYYKIVIVNDGSEPVTTVVINDVLPSYTKVLQIGTFTVDAGTVPSIAFGSNLTAGATTGNIALNIPQLDPTEQVTLYFAVTVQE